MRRIPNLWNLCGPCVFVVLQIGFGGGISAGISVIVTGALLLIPTLFGLWGQGDRKMKSVQVTEFTPDGSDSGSPEHEYYLSMSVNGDNLTRNIQLTNLTHPGTTFPGDFDFVESSLTNQTFVTETTTVAMPGDVMQVSVEMTGGVWISQNVTLPGITGACLYGCPEWTSH